MHPFRLQSVPPRVTAAAVIGIITSKSSQSPANVTASLGPSTSTAAASTISESGPPVDVVSSPGPSAISEGRSPFDVVSCPSPRAAAANVISNKPTPTSSVSGQDNMESFGPFQLHSPSPEPFRLVSDKLGNNDEDDNEPAAQEKKVRPGPLTNEQKVTCHSIAQEYMAKMLALSEEWGVHETTVSRQCGLGVKEHRGPNQWCIWQERWFPENPRGSTGACASFPRELVTSADHHPSI